MPFLTDLWRLLAQPSWRLAALPWWAWVALRARLRGRGAPLLTVRVDARTPLPPVHLWEHVVASASVRGVHLHVAGLQGGWASLAATREALLRVRAAGKRVVVELDHCGNGELYLASAADHVWMRPLGEVQALGVAAALQFAGDLFSRLGVRFDFEAAGAYKSFGETWTRAWASAENREAVAALVGDLQAELEAGIAEGRRLAPEAVRAVFVEGPLPADDAVRRGLVDAVVYPDEAKTRLDELFGEDTRRVPFPAWAAAVHRLAGLEAWMERRPRVVVVHLRGPVVDGEGPPGAATIAAEPVGELLRALGEDDEVAAVVLAVQSPGGSALASDLLWRSVELLNRRKVVLAAFGDVAASGGFYLAAGAREIWALPNSITGSIGVVGGKVVVTDALAKVGVHGEAVLGAPHALMYRSEAPFSPEERLRFRASLQRFYAAFVARVAAGRHRPVAEIEPHAQGRVWTGRRAHSLGLVDHLGPTSAVVARARTLAGAADAARIDLVLEPRSGWLVRLARSWLETRWPELGLLHLPPTLRMVLAHQGRALCWWPFEVVP